MLTHMFQQQHQYSKYLIFNRILILNAVKTVRFWHSKPVNGCIASGQPRFKPVVN